MDSLVVILALDLQRVATTIENTIGGYIVFFLFCFLLQVKNRHHFLKLLGCSPFEHTVQSVFLDQLIRLVVVGKPLDHDGDHGGTDDEVNLFVDSKLDFLVRVGLAGIHLIYH